MNNEKLNISDEEIEKLLIGANGNYCTLEVCIPYKRDIKKNGFVPKDLEQYPNSCKYDIFSYNPVFDMKEARIIERKEISERVIIKLKKIHGIHDPWDDDTEYIKNLIKNNKVQSDF